MKDMKDAVQRWSGSEDLKGREKVLLEGLSNRDVVVLKPLTGPCGKRKRLKRTCRRETTHLSQMRTREISVKVIAHTSCPNEIKC